MKKIFNQLLSVVLACVFTACQDSSLLTIGGLKCEMLESPLAIDNTSPHFSWQMSSKQKGAVSSAYQILVATSLDKLNEEDADLYDIDSDSFLDNID